MNEGFDLVIRGGEVYDGTGAPAVKADVGVRGDEIAAVGPELRGGETVLDAGGLAVAPGFIDIHAHSDLTLLENPRGESKLHQGVTTEVNGQCGLTPFPLHGVDKEVMEGVCSFIVADVEWDWTSTSEYLERLAAAELSYNVAALIGHSGLRASTVGFDNRLATAEEVQRMRELLREAFQAGAIGFSTCLSYPLGAFAGEDEVEALVEECGRAGRLWTCHIRDEGPRLIESIEEVLNLARRTESRLEIDHLKATGKANWGKVKQALELIERAYEDGMEVGFDAYPYAAGSRHLHGSLPDWCQSGGTQAMLQRLRDPDCRRRLREEMGQWAQGHGAGGGFALDFEATQITAVKTERNEWTVGKRLSEIAQERGQEPLEATLDLLLEEEGYVSAVFHTMNEGDVKAVLQHPLGCVGSDGIAFAPYGNLGKGKPHPRSYGTFPRFLGHYCREAGLLPLTEGIRKITSLPASRLRLGDRGVVRPGMKADLVVFDPERIIDRADYADPHQYPEGIAAVIVNGAVTLQGEQHTERGEGRLLGA